ncbi:NERD domain-containing protein [Pseudomonas nitroreducens]|nr:nuclease-related domain-containing protein [Pseudomonas nitroreducens]MDG9857302.1 NERD domain-containing protein [Pseudomonas nitroreducens]MDH1076604.1 NERD domain-containing protein [Pseudomonas nitroreducens]
MGISMEDFLWIYAPPVALMLLVGAGAHTLLLARPAYRGWWGEYKVNFALRLCLSGEYRVFSNALYRGQTDDETTQIDHIVVSRYGLFVIETKCFRGRIVTDPNAPDTWLQRVGRRKYKVRNPLLQNYAHVKALHRVTGIHSQQIQSFVVMAGQAKFVYGMPEGVFSIWSVVRKIQGFRAPVFTAGHVSSITKALERCRVKGGYWAAKRHVELLKRKETRRKNAASSKLQEECPKQSQQWPQ